MVTWKDFKDDMGEFRRITPTSAAVIILIGAAIIYIARSLL